MSLLGYLTDRFRKRGVTSSCNGERTLNNPANDMALSTTCTLLLVVLMVSSCCGMTLLYCGGIMYDYDTDICCYRRARIRPLDWAEVSCCATDIFNPKTHMCCEQPKIDDSFIVELKAGESKSVTCSKEKPKTSPKRS
ncbi:hypothetical protein LSAT2_010289 [Lamellibrachia satsuma]|nr:hypothetical protein LSAT2_010289 [Lamellibrachia satsuma]